MSLGTPRPLDFVRDQRIERVTSLATPQAMLEDQPLGTAAAEYKVEASKPVFVCPSVSLPTYFRRVSKGGMMQPRQTQRTTLKKFAFLSFGLV